MPFGSQRKYDLILIFMNKNVPHIFVSTVTINISSLSMKS